jgi:4-alpha-glucanotransferase
MTDTQLADLAQQAGFNIHWTDALGRPRQITPEAQRALLGARGYAAHSMQQINASLAALRDAQLQAPPPALITLDQGGAPSLAAHFTAFMPFQLRLENGQYLDGRLDDIAALPPIDQCGYHQLLIGENCVTLAVAPHACPSVRELLKGAVPARVKGRIWGLTAQLYALRQHGDGGIGNTAALETLLRNAASKGADAVAISPVHAMFSANPSNFSPYSPSSRLFFNVLHAAPARVLGEAAVRQAIASARLGETLARLETLPLIDWPAAASARQRLLRQLYTDFCTSPQADRGQLRDDFRLFREQGGHALTQHCLFEALHADMLAQGLAYDWRQWPTPYRDPDHPTVRRYADEHAEEISFHAFGQWLIARCLSHAQHTARDAGMHIGLIADLAVGADSAGSQAWSQQSQLLPGLSVGAPPDILNRQGQSWGVTAFCPQGLLRHGFGAFIDMLHANLAHAGGIRIDHVMGLQRLWVVPQGMSAEAGGYLNYPFTDLLRLLTLEASRHRALVIGEDLGTVPDGLRAQLAKRNILGMRVLLFEQADGHFIAPQHWPNDALATTSTHDLPTLRGWFGGNDIDWQKRCGQSDDEQHRKDHAARACETGALQHALALKDANLLNTRDADANVLVDACVDYIAHTPAPLVLLPLEDALGLIEQPNLPASTDAHPNWRRRLPVQSDELLDQPHVRDRLQVLDKACR